MMEELTVLIKYKLIQAKEAERTKTQYKNIYFHDGYAFLKKYLIDPKEIQKRNIQDIYTKQAEERLAQPQQTPTPQAPTTPNTQTPPNQKKFSIDQADQEDDDPFNSIDDYVRSLKNDQLPPGTIGISTKTIREITGYSYTVQKPWHSHPVDIPWQKLFIESPHNIIVVD
jgi:hypothetical protein